MKKIEWLWNLVYYYLYRLDLKMNYIFYWINPFYWLKYNKRYATKFRVDDKTDLAKVIFEDPKNGLSSIIAGSFMGVLLLLIEYGFFNVIQMILDKSLIYFFYHDSLYFLIFFLIFIIPMIVINNDLLFQKDKYLNYFKDFDKMNNNKKVTYGWLSFFFIIFIFIFFIGSFFIL